LEENLSLEENLRAKGAIDPKCVYFIAERTLERAEWLVAIGGRVRTERTEGTSTKQDLLEAMFEDNKGRLGISTGKHALTESTFRRLLCMGYPFDENDFVIIDADSEADLQGVDLKIFSWSSIDDILTSPDL